jgi:hypothetical protein
MCELCYLVLQFHHSTDLILLFFSDFQQCSLKYQYYQGVYKHNRLIVVLSFGSLLGNKYFLNYLSQDLYILDDLINQAWSISIQVLTNIKFAYQKNNTHIFGVCEIFLTEDIDGFTKSVREYQEYILTRKCINIIIECINVMCTNHIHGIHVFVALEVQQCSLKYQYSGSDKHQICLSEK